MQQTSSSRCYYVGCPKRPTYGVDMSRKRESCAEHARPGMVNIDLTRCVFTCSYTTVLESCLVEFRVLPSYSSTRAPCVSSRFRSWPASTSWFHLLRILPLTPFPRFIFFTGISYPFHFICVVSSYLQPPPPHHPFHDVCFSRTPKVR